MTNRLDTFLAYSESNRLVVSAAAAVLIAIVALFDWQLSDMSIGFLYLLPILLTSAALRNWQILAMAVLCGYLREAMDPSQGGPRAFVAQILYGLNPSDWAAGSTGRLLVSTIGFAMTGFFVAELNHRRRRLAAHLAERERQILLREDAERQLRILIETSPLAILTLDEHGVVRLANESAHELLGSETNSLPGQPIAPYLPFLDRMLHSHRGGPNIRTNVECSGQRLGGEVFLAHVWLSTFRTSAGPGLAAVVWDASENLRDREGAGLDSMMATSRVLIGAMSHEIRNLASAAASAHLALGSLDGISGNEQYHALGSLIRGLEKIASSGLRLASDRERVVADLGTVLDETRIVIEPTLRESGVRVVWEIAPGLPLVQADHHSLLQVLVNLARNSRQALEQAETREVRIWAGLEKDLVVVRFRDTGPGVAHPEDLFQPFQPGAHSHGIGLYISRAILRSHGGGLRYEPEPGGSCFAVELWPVENPAVQEE